VKRHWIRAVEGWTLMASYTFPLGQLVAPPGALDVITFEQVHDLIERHRSGDWGDVSEQDWAANARALVEGSRLFSSFNISKYVRIWVITEANRSATTILLPCEY
jgi:hypothetical protein